MSSKQVRDIVASAEKPQETIDEAVVRLAQLSPLEYDQVRKDEADKLGVRASTLDEEVSKKRPDDVSGDTNSMLLQEAEPWHEEVNGKALFNDLVRVFNKYLALQKYQPETLALWAIFSYCIDANNIAPKLLVYSPEKRCGKTTLLDVLIGLVWKGLPASNITPAAIFRTIEAIGGTIIIDEADTFINESPEINGIINSGHRKSSAFVIRLVGDSHEPKQFSTWSPNIPHRAEPELKILARKIRRWSNDNFDDLRDSDPETPPSLNDRAADNWRPLFAIADLIGDECSKLSRFAAVGLSEEDEDEDDSTGTALLADIRDVFQAEKGRTRISTEDLLESLYALEDRPWVEWNRGKPMTPRQMAKYLKPFKIKSKTIRFSYGGRKGYMTEAFEEAFSRYLPSLSVTALQPKQGKAFSDSAIRNASQNVTDDNALKSRENLTCNGVTDEEIVW
jgi:putative DNA primase/helicase